jgi:hypothetical protein
MFEDIVRHLAAQGDTGSLIERPVDPEINTALTVFFFCFGERRVVASDEGSYPALIVECLTVELVRDKGEPNTVCPIKLPKHLKQRAPERGVA